MTIQRLNGQQPRIAADVFIAPGAVIIGDVEIGAGASVWCNAVIRGDAAPIRIGPGSNIQDGAILHADPGAPCIIGANVTVGHAAIVHGCTIGDHSLIGMHATVLNLAVIEPESLVAAGALVRERATFAARSMIVGLPAVLRRPLTDDEVAGLHASAAGYRQRAALYRAEGLGQSLLE
jgi:carbonic anhydrase/acetyltransferase-like protein (isoleucine patch superfamily)